MPGRGGSSVIVNHRVALSGTKARAAVAAHRIEYIATRPGCDRSATEADVARAREREAMVGYVGCRPGSTALFDADGAVSLAEARRRLAGCRGAVVCSVIAVRRGDCERFGLDTKEGWQAYARANLTREYACMMGVPESRVGWVAAHHLNSAANQHIHVLAYDREGEFDRIMARRDMERARRRLTEAAIAPEVARLGVEREVARRRAVELLRGAGREEIGRGVELPADGRISYGHLRRWHPEAARQVEAAVRRAAEADPLLREAFGAYGEACRKISDIKGLRGAERKAYLFRSEADMRSRACNAALRALVPERLPDPELPEAGRVAVSDGPSLTRRRELAVRRELAACMSGRQAREALAAVRRGGPVPWSSVRGCPVFESLRRHSPEVLESALAQAGRMAADAMFAGDGRLDSAEEARAVLGMLSRVAVRATLHGDAPTATSAHVEAAVSRPIKVVASI